MRKGDWKECWSVHAVGRNLAAGKGKGGNGSRCEQEMRKGDRKECWSAYAVGAIWLRAKANQRWQSKTNHPGGGKGA